MIQYNTTAAGDKIPAAADGEPSRSFRICLENSLNFVGHACSVTDQSRHVKNVTYIFVLEGEPGS